MDEKKYVDPSIEMDEGYGPDVDPAYEMDNTERKKMRKQTEQYIIERYQNEEEMMILLFAQFCINHNLNPETIYEEAYPAQGKNKFLQAAIDKTVAKEASEAIPIDLLQDALQAFGNDDLIFVLQNHLQKSKAQNGD